MPASSMNETERSAKAPFKWLGEVGTGVLHLLHAFATQLQKGFSMRWRTKFAVLALVATAAAPAPVPPGLQGQYDPGNPFARIVRGELPAAKVYEDAYVIAFMDIHPIAPGHVLVISKTSKAHTLLEMSPKDVARLMRIVQKVGRAQLVALGVGGFTVIQNNGLGQSVPQVHFHVIPRRDGGALKMEDSRSATPAELQVMAARLRAAIVP